MTGNDHDNAPLGDAVTGALGGAAHPFELAHEVAVTVAMADVLLTAPEPSSVRRPRRVAAFAAVTIASFGVGGIIAAGPGKLVPFYSDDDAPATTVLDEPSPTTEDETGDDDTDTGRITTDPDVECAEGNHGRTVSSVAHAGGDTNAAAHSDCGKPTRSGDGAGDTSDDDADDDDADGRNDEGGGVERVTTDLNVDCAEGNHGRTVSSVADAGGDTNAAAHSKCGKPVKSAANGNARNKETSNNDDQADDDSDDTDQADADSDDTDQADADSDDTDSDDTDSDDTGNGPPASTPGNPNPGPPAGTLDNANGNNGNGAPASTPPAG